ncbi:hypothetical protein L1987_47173 [Smallanthus sonchifolius]|uniref:Uncharacterized protein n=1 Tax=Smallanthus sonchifolius TaxID=185202 RepID=A0ACB9G2F3_9ASTR|nr:hypothetical protein L1987_47173 [Smallanthus sonchifolius]
MEAGKNHTVYQPTKQISRQIVNYYHNYNANFRTPEICSHKYKGDRGAQARRRHCASGRHRVRSSKDAIEARASAQAQGASGIPEVVIQSLTPSGQQGIQSVG